MIHAIMKSKAYRTDKPAIRMPPVTIMTRMTGVSKMTFQLSDYADITDTIAIVNDGSVTVDKENGEVRYGDHVVGTLNIPTGVSRGGMLLELSSPCSLVDGVAEDIIQSLRFYTVDDNPTPDQRKLTISITTAGQETYAETISIFMLASDKPVRENPHLEANEFDDAGSAEHLAFAH